MANSLPPSVSQSWSGEGKASIGWEVDPNHIVSRSSRIDLNVPVRNPHVMGNRLVYTLQIIPSRSLTVRP